MIGFFVILAILELVQYATKTADLLITQSHLASKAEEYNLFSETALNKTTGLDLKGLSDPRKSLQRTKYWADTVGNLGLGVRMKIPP